MDISVLMSVYIQTEENELSECLKSIEAQTLAPSQLVVVVDGPVRPGVTKLLESQLSRTSYSVEIVNFTENRGLGAALSDGLNSCRHELVARVDTDDVNLPTRFEVQHEFFLNSPDISAVGGFLAEIYGGIRGEKFLVRTVPVDSDKIRSSCRYRNPINHPTVMFRRKDVLQVGGYQPMLWFEDYYLWARLIMNGYSLGNIDQVLVTARADNSYFRRRGGFSYFKQELNLATEFRKIGFHTMLQSVRFIATRFIFRIVPVQARSWLYLFLLRNGDSKFGRP